MDEQVVEIDTQKFMPVYQQLSNNKLEVEVARAYERQVAKDVSDAQGRADIIVNALTSRRNPPNFPVARSALKMLAGGPAVVVAHWQKFISAVAEVLPPAAEGETDDVKVVDEAAEAVELKDLRALFGRLGAILPLVSARELRELREGFGMLGEAIGAEFGKRGMPFDRDGSAAKLERIERELETALTPGPLPKDFAFSDKRVMAVRAALDQGEVQLKAADERLAAMKDQAAAGETDASDAEARIKGLEAQVAALTTERDGAMKTRDEMAQAADKHEKASAENLAHLDAEMKRNTELELALTKLKADTAEATSELDAQKRHGVELTHKLAEEKKRAGELEHEVEQLKKKSSKQR